MTETRITKKVFLRASPQQVWAYLTEPDKLERWFHVPKAPLTEGPMAMYGAQSGDKLIWGDVLEAQPFSKLVYTFTVKPMGDATSTVTWTWRDVAGGTELSLLQEGLAQDDDSFGLVLALDKGWDDHLGRMRADMHAD